MRHLESSDSRSTRGGRKRQRPLLTLREWWWTQDRRRPVARMVERDRRLTLEEAYVVDALAHQLEEIRNLPEVVR